MAKETIKITCYDETEIWDDREKAKSFYLECMLASEGSEHNRYCSIYEQLCCGYTECSDEDDW
jgi:hypothetical protein